MSDRAVFFDEYHLAAVKKIDGIVTILASAPVMHVAKLGVLWTYPRDTLPQ